ncbi:hypothetical protein HY745_10220 [Candidatus Desantisbacteria bacterium]|nr:hypothetical protein [Candidatus Desantisbacteria bacterium]
MALFAAKSLGWVITFFIELLQTKRIYNLGGHAFTASERNFFNAYRLHASRMGVTTNIDVADEELKEEYYMKSLEELSYKWPEVVNRFTTD